MIMKRIVVICEGPTEKEFCNTILSPFFAPQGIYLNAPLIKHSHGGIVPWPLLERQISIHLRAERNAHVISHVISELTTPVFIFVNTAMQMQNRK